MVGILTIMVPTAEDHVLVGVQEQVTRGMNLKVTLDHEPAGHGVIVNQSRDVGILDPSRTHQYTAGHLDSVDQTPRHISWLPPGHIAPRHPYAHW
jgi:hypothetical protein